MRKFLAVSLLALTAALPARATTFATDASDLWWNQNESGWGANVIQQKDTLFMTFFVYAANGTPTWYVAPATIYSGTAGNPPVYSGQLYQTNGPWFGAAAFDPNAVTNRVVGTVTFTLVATNSATLSYTVDGVAVTKSLTRQTWRVEDMSGTFLGLRVGTYSNDCPQTGYVEEMVPISISQSATSFGMTIFGTTICALNGAYTQTGRMGSATGTASCGGLFGTTGPFSLSEMEGNTSGFTTRATIAQGTCTWSGRIGAVRRGS